MSAAVKACVVCEVKINTKDKYSEYLECSESSCGNLTHIDECSGINYKYIASKRKSYKCVKCRHKQNLTSNTENTTKDPASGSTPLETDSITPVVEQDCHNSKCKKKELQIRKLEKRIEDLTREVATISDQHQTELKNVKELRNKYIEVTSALVKSFDLLLGAKNRTTSSKVKEPADSEQDPKKKETFEEMANSEKTMKAPRPEKIKKQKNFAWNPIYMCKGDIL